MSCSAAGCLGKCIASYQFWLFAYQRHTVAIRSEMDRFAEMFAKHGLAQRKKAKIIPMPSIAGEKQNATFIKSHAHWRHLVLSMSANKTYAEFGEFLHEKLQERTDCTHGIRPNSTKNHRRHMKLQRKRQLKKKNKIDDAATETCTTLSSTTVSSITTSSTSSSQSIAQDGAKDNKKPQGGLCIAQGASLQSKSLDYASDKSEPLSSEDPQTSDEE